MILIGFNSREAASGWTPNRNDSGPREGEANRIEAGIREFFRKLGRWEVHFLFERPPQFPDRFIIAEATAVRNLNLRLFLNRSLALMGRRPYQTSWLFKRIHELASDPHLEVELWTIPYGRNTGFRGHTSFSPPKIFIHLHHLLHGADLGEVICHELAIHAWRMAGSRPSTHHQDLFHVGDTDRFPSAYRPRHSLADTEADVLTLILRGMPPRRRIPSRAQRAHDRHVWRSYDSVVAASQGSGDFAAIEGLTIEEQYRQWREYSPTRVGTALRPRRLPGSP